METLKTMTPEQAELLVMFEPLLYDMDSEYRIAVDEAREVCAINYDTVSGVLEESQR